MFTARQLFKYARNNHAFFSTNNTPSSNKEGVVSTAIKLGIGAGVATFYNTRENNTPRLKTYTAQFITNTPLIENSNSGYIPTRPFVK